MSIEDRLVVYGPAVCPICGKHKETVFAGRYQLTCRDHPGHPLYEGPEPGGLTSGTRDPLRRAS